MLRPKDRSFRLFPFVKLITYFCSLVSVRKTAYSLQRRRLWLIISSAFERSIRIAATVLPFVVILLEENVEYYDFYGRLLDIWKIWPL